MARRSTKLLRFENSLYNYDQKNHTWTVQSINIQNDKTKFDLFDSGTHSVCKRMSQKVNPINFRRGTSVNWDSLYHRNYKEFNLLECNSFHKELLVTKYLDNVFTNLNIFSNKIRISELNNKLYINISFFEPKGISKRDILINPKRLNFFKSLNLIKQQSNDLNTKTVPVLNPFYELNEKNAKPSWDLSKEKLITHLEKYIKVITNKNVKVSLHSESGLGDGASMFSKYLASEVEKFNGNFKRALRESLKEIKNNAKIKGIRVNGCGRLGKAPMAKTEWFKYGQIPLNEISAFVDYASSTANTKYGCVGIKVWIYFYN